MQGLVGRCPAHSPRSAQAAVHTKRRLRSKASTLLAFAFYNCYACSPVEGLVGQCHFDRAPTEVAPAQAGQGVTAHQQRPKACRKARKEYALGMD